MSRKRLASFMSLVPVQAQRVVDLDMLQKTEELLVPVARSSLGEHPAVGDVEGGKQGCRTVSHIVMGDPFDIAQTQRQYRLAAFACLDLRFLVDAQHNGMIRRIEVEPHVGTQCCARSNRGLVDATGSSDRSKRRQW
jgi:hypothetical protein